jgi:hypothetical protein
VACVTANLSLRLLLLLLLQGIEGFAADQKKLEEQLAKLAGGMKH